MSEQTTPVQQEAISPEIIRSLVLDGDLSKMNQDQKVEYYNRFCYSLGLNPLTQPFQLIKFQGKEKMYATKDCTEQLRKIHGVSITDVTTQQVGDIFVVTAKAKDATGKTDAATGAINIKGLGGENLANALMKGETKAKRRVTLSICGLGMLDESELDTMPPHVTAPVTPSKPVIVRDKDGIVTDRWNKMLRAIEEGKTTIEIVKETCIVPDKFDEMVRHDLTLYNDEVPFTEMHDTPTGNPESSDNPNVQNVQIDF
jgi:hypothetical protein